MRDHVHVGQGSSPRMRGTLRGHHDERGHDGIIPAYAGNTPHAIGSAGSLGGIIPAYAGNTCSTSSNASVTRDHPRVCGEHRWLRAVPSAPAGSSPRMRGTQARSTLTARPPWIIPAYAGNTYPLAGIRSYTWDHPRVCGEHLHRCQTTNRWEGSSPRMRGTPSFQPVGIEYKGIIPAYAGNTSPPLSDVPSDGDHPRVCGEHFSTTMGRERLQGSSPRMRGTH